MALRKGVAGLLPRLVSGNSQLLAPTCSASTSLSAVLGGAGSSSAVDGKSYATDSLTQAKATSSVTPCNKLTMTPSHHIQYDEHHHTRFEPGTNQKAFAYMVLTGGRFVYASAIRLAAIKVIMSLSAAADTLAMSSLEVDLSNIQEGQTVTVKWRGKPVFIRHRTEEEINEAMALNVSELRDAQTDKERVVDPKYLVVVGICTHLGCVPISGAGDYSGWFCPCHGSHYDISGRIRKGPAPYNLEVPEYKFIEEKKVIIG